MANPRESVRTFVEFLSSRAAPALLGGSVHDIVKRAIVGDAGSGCGAKASPVPDSKSNTQMSQRVARVPCVRLKQLPATSQKRRRRRKTQGRCAGGANTSRVVTETVRDYLQEVRGPSEEETKKFVDHRLILEDIIACLDSNT